MNTLTTTPVAGARLPNFHAHAGWRTVGAQGPVESRRAAFVDDTESRLDAIGRAVAYLAARGVYVSGADPRLGQPGKPVLRIAASSYVHTLFGEGEAASGQHHDPRNGTMRDFRAVCLGCEVHWSEPA